MPEIDTNLNRNSFEAIANALSGAIIGVEAFRGTSTILVKRESIRDVIAHLKRESGFHFQMMTDLFAMDYLKLSKETPERYAVVYILYSFDRKEHVVLKSYLPEDNPRIDSIHDLYKAANWFEREAWDLFGIEFAGHPNLVRILCHNDFEGHPLRKDYPADGYQQLKAASPSSGF